MEKQNIIGRKIDEKGRYIKTLDNAEVNFNRTHWTKFFQSMLSERYGYQYDEKGNVILDIEIKVT